MKSVPEETLDPDNWDAFRRLMHQAVDDALDYTAGVRERPVWQPVPKAVRAELTAAVPRTGEGAEAAYKDYQRLVAPYPLGNIHPRFWGWVNGSGTPVGILAELLAATMNVNAAGFDQASTYVELQVIEWFRELMGFPAGASGILITGGSVANLVGINVARNAVAPFAVRHLGLTGKPRLMLYTSAETHNSVRKAVELMGLGVESLGSIPVDAEYCMDVAALKARIAADKRSGHLPFCVVANAGTVNTGAVDPLNAIADICQAEKLWLHVNERLRCAGDRLHGPASRSLLKGMEPRGLPGLRPAQMDAYALRCGLPPWCASGEKHKAAFAVQASYLNKLEGGIANAPVAFSDYGPQLSRGFRALKVWLNFKAYGVDKFARLIAQNVRQAQYLKERVEAAPELELLAPPVPLNVVNFRYRAKGLDEAALDGLNARILIALQERGIAAPSSTMLQGRFAIRTSITNPPQPAGGLRCPHGER